MRFLGDQDKGLLRDADARKAVGVKIAVIGLLVGVTGALLVVYVSESIGEVLFFLGFAGVFVGLMTSLVMLVLPKTQNDNEE